MICVALEIYPLISSLQVIMNYQLLSLSNMLVKTKRFHVKRLIFLVILCSCVKRRKALRASFSLMPNSRNKVNGDCCSLSQNSHRPLEPPPPPRPCMAIGPHRWLHGTLKQIPTWIQVYVDGYMERQHRCQHRYKSTQMPTWNVHIDTYMAFRFTYMAS